MNPQRTFLLETNRSGRTTEQNRRFLEKHGYDAARLPHQPTAIFIRDPQDRTWSETRLILARLANSSNSSIVVMSGRTGNVFHLDRRGNRPKTWVRQ